MKIHGFETSFLVGQALKVLLVEDSNADAELCVSALENHGYKVRADIVATGSFEAKADVLLERNVTCFVEDRLDTCFLLERAGITPILFKQPWNRQPHGFVEVGSWSELEALIHFS